MASEVESIVVSKKDARCLNWQSNFILTGVKERCERLRASWISFFFLELVVGINVLATPSKKYVES